jgi:hypothetical protein
MKRTFKYALGLVLSCLPATLSATGYFGPNVYLDEGGKRVDASPEFYWELEVKRLASQFHPTEHFIESQAKPDEEGKYADNARALHDSEAVDADVRDFADAIQNGRIKPPNSEKAAQQHETARNQINDPKAQSLPDEFDSEFADYHRGAFAYRRGQDHWEEARQAWQELLNRPANDRHYRSVWAAFMLGKLSLKTNSPEAVKWFQKTRELAKQGFADSLGMAADSYGWEGRSEWKQGHPGNAAQLFLTQLALGDESAIVSLKALVPDRQAIEGMLNYGPEPEEIEKWTEEQRKQREIDDLSKLREAARDPFLRRLVTVHILSTISCPDFYTEGTKANARCARWLSVIEEAKLGKVDDAEYLGWAAYNIGAYKVAERWLNLGNADTPAAWWLRAKLQRRAGKLADAAKSMAKAMDLMRDSKVYASSDQPSDENEVFHPYGYGGHWTFQQSASGDLGALRLDRNNFVQALDTLLEGDLWEDAAYVAERVLTADELKKYVDDHSGNKARDDEQIGKLRYVLGRRLVREDRYDEASRYLPAPYYKILERYAKALKEGADTSRPPLERARAWFTAAWLARYDGMELMGTEGAPDGFAEEGEFPIPDIGEERLTGVYKPVDLSDEEHPPKALPAVLKASSDERQRIQKNKTRPDVRFHYRLVAGALAIKAAALLPNDSEELADVVNRAGLWVKEQDQTTGNRYFQIIEQRCRKTKMGRAVIAKHWFVDQSGPWSDAQQEAYDALHKELKTDTDQ